LDSERGLPAYRSRREARQAGTKKHNHRDAYGASAKEEGIMPAQITITRRK
jgi:hypothetical protein